MTTPGGSGPIETAFIEIKPKVSAQFAEDIRKEIIPILKKMAAEAEAAFKQVESSSRQASLGVRSVTRSLNSASKASNNFAQNAVRNAVTTGGAFQAAGRQASTAFRGVDGATESAGRSVDRLGGRFSSMARLATAAGAVVGTALAGISAYGISAAARLEQIDIAFTGLMGNAELADDFIVKLQKFAAVTPFEFEDLAKATQRLLALGQTGDQALDTLTTVGNAAAAVGADQTSINRVIVALAQISAKGKLSAEEINQVGEALPNLDRGAVVENLAEIFGVTTDKIREMQEKGLIPAKEGTEALLKTLQEVPGALGAMDRQALTLLGRFSTFKDTIKADFSQALQGSLPEISEALTSLTGVISAQLKTFGPALGEALVTLAPVVESLVNTIGPVLTSAMSTLAPVIASLAPALAPLGQIISTTLGVLGPALATIGSALAPLIEILGTHLAAAIQQLSPLLSAISTLIARVFIALAPLLDELLASIVPVVTVLVDSLVPVINVLADMFIALIPSMQPMIAAFGELMVALTPLIQILGVALVAALEMLVPVITAIVEHHMKDMILVFKALAAVIEHVIIPAVKFMLTLFLELFENIVRSAASAFGWVPELGDKLKAAEKAVTGMREKVNAELAAIERNVTISVHTVYTSSTKELNDLQDEKAVARELRKNPRTFGGVPKPSGTPKFLPGKSKSGGGGKSPETLAKEAAKKIRDALIKLADAALDAAKKMADGIKTQLDSASDTLRKLRDQFADIRDAIADAFSVDLFESRSAKQFLKRATKNIVKNTSVFQSQGILQKALGGQEGGSEFLRQLFESGNTRLIKNLASQSAATLQEVLAKFNQDTALANKIGTAVASAFLVGGKPLAIAIHSVRDEVIRLQKLMVAALAKVEAATKARERLKTASGGIFTAATDIQVGEAGREVVVPLTRPGAALDLLLKSGALGLPNVAAHLSGLQEAAESQSLDRLRAVGIPGGPTYVRTPQNAAQAAPPPPMLKVVKERTVNQTFHISEAGDARLTAASVAARTASYMDR